MSGEISNAQRAQWALAALQLPATTPGFDTPEGREVALEHVRDLMTNLEHFMRLTLQLPVAERRRQREMALGMANVEEQEDSDQ